MSCAFDTALRARVIRHMVEVIAKTPVETAPFPHFCVRGFLPADVYGDLLGYIPAPSLYEPFGYEKHQENGESNRLRFQLNGDQLKKLPSQSGKFWQTVRSALSSEELKQATFDKLAPGLSFRYGIAPEKVKDLTGHALPELFYETEGYKIKPHPDTRKKVVTMQIALAEDASQEQMGTEFYRRSVNPRTWVREPRGFEIAKRMPFLPNTAYAFSVLNTLTLKSWHGRTAISGQYGPRSSLLNIWYQHAEHLKQAA